MLRPLFVTLALTAGALGFGADAAMAQTAPSGSNSAGWPQGGLYVRADLGYGFTGDATFSQQDLMSLGGRFTTEDIGDAVNFGVGAGWRPAPWLRLDATAEYRTWADVDAVDSLTRELKDPDGRVTASTVYDGHYSAIVAMANLYMDLPKVDLFTPYVGAGLGVAFNKFTGFETTSTGTFVEDATGDTIHQTSSGSAGDRTEAQFAWALMAGVAVDLSDHAKLDIGYRYLDLGGKVAVSTQAIECHCGAVGAPLEASNLDAHEIRVGLRWEFDGGPR